MNCFFGISYFLLLAALGLRCYARAFSSCGDRGLLIMVASLEEHQLQGAWALVVAADGISCPAASGIFLDQGLYHCPCTAGQILNFWTTREASELFLKTPKDNASLTMHLLLEFTRCLELSP